MKVLVVTQYFWPESFKINDLVIELKNRGHEVTVYTGIPNYPNGEFYAGYSFSHPTEENYHGVKVIRVPLIARGKGLGIKLVLNYISFCFFATILAPFKVKGDFDRIFIYQLSPIFSCLPAVYLRFLKRAPSIIWVTDLWPDSLEATGVVKNKCALSLVGLFVKFIYRFSDKIYISSRGFKSKILDYGVPETKIKFWPQWAETFFDSYNSDSNTYRDDSLEKILTPDSFILMFAGNIGTSQDMPTLIEAASKLALDGKYKYIHFVILGDGVMREWTAQEVKKRGLEENFHLLGKRPIESMPYYYSKAGALLVSLVKTDLFSITIPSKLQTYLASGKPILASMDGEGAEIVNNWKVGLSSPASNPIILAKKIIQFSQFSGVELQEMENNALSCYKAEFERNKLISVLEQDLASLKF